MRVPEPISHPGHFTRPFLFTWTMISPNQKEPNCRVILNNLMEITVTNPIHTMLIQNQQNGWGGCKILQESSSSYMYNGKLYDWPCLLYGILANSTKKEKGIKTYEYKNKGHDIVAPLTVLQLIIRKRKQSFSRSFVLGIHNPPDKIHFVHSNNLLFLESVKSTFPQRRSDKILEEKRSSICTDSSDYQFLYIPSRKYRSVTIP